MNAAVDPVEVLQVDLVDGRDRPAGEHDPLHGEQLLDSRILEELAPELQPLDHPVRVLRLDVAGMRS